MSAYALPGLFPPVEESGSADTSSSFFTSTASNGSISHQETLNATVSALKPSEVCPDNHCDASTAHNDKSSFSCSIRSNASASFCSTSQTQPQKYHSNSNHKKAGNPSSIFRRGVSMLPSNSYAQLPLLKSLDDETEDDALTIKSTADDPDPTTVSSSSDNTMLGIAIKRAKIDPVRFVQFLSGGSKRGTQNSSSSSKTLRRRNSASSSSPPGSPVYRRSLLDFSTSSSNSCETYRRFSHPSSSSGSNSSSPENEAIEFELSISFHGRKYTAKRTMQCIIKLRDDLIREMNARKQWLLTARSPLSAPPYLSNQHKLSSSMQVCTTAASDDMGNDNSLQIPEIPPLDFSSGDDHHRDSQNPHPSMVGGMGFVGRGFTMLHAVLTSYVPVMDRWLKNVMAIVPQDSECLLNFLWEPLSTSLVENEFGSLLESSTMSKKDSCRSMGSIKELDFEGDDEDEEDQSTP